MLLSCLIYTDREIIKELTGAFKSLHAVMPVDFSALEDNKSLDRHEGPRLVLLTILPHPPTTTTMGQGRGSLMQTPALPDLSG